MALFRRVQTSSSSHLELVSSEKNDLRKLSEQKTSTIITLYIITILHHGNRSSVSLDTDPNQLHQ